MTHPTKEERILETLDKSLTLIVNLRNALSDEQYDEWQDDIQKVSSDIKYELEI